MSVQESIALVAERNASEMVWKTDVARTVRRNPRVKFPAGAYKCNLFVYEVLLAAGAPAPTYSSGQPIAAGDWGNSKFQINGWRILADDEKPQRGDVLSRPLAGPNSTGHVCIVVGADKTVGTGGDGTIVRGDFGFRFFQYRDPGIMIWAGADKITIRRCTK